MPETAQIKREPVLKGDTVSVSAVVPSVTRPVPRGGRRVPTILRTSFTARTWRAHLYLIVATVLAVPGFVLAVTSTVLGVALAVTFLGLPMLALGGAAAIRFGAVHRRLARRLLGLEVVPAGGRRPGRGIVGRVQSGLSDPVAWRALLYLLLKLPMMLASVYVLFVVYFEGVVLTLYPLWWILPPPSPTAARAPTGVLALGAVIGRGDAVVAPRADHRLILHVAGLYLDSWPWVIATCLVGIVALLLATWIAIGAARLDVLVMRALLGPTRDSVRVERLEAARSVVAQDAAATLRRIERDLHDGTQAQLVALAMKLGTARDRLADQHDPVTFDLIASAHQQTKDALDELRHIARGIHPPALDVGLEAALQTLTSRSAVPATLRVTLRTRPSDAVATIAYYAVAELLTNVAKHAEASAATVVVTEKDAALVVIVTDDGRGGATPSGGSGLAGLASRLDAVDGSLRIDSPDGGPTAVTVSLPVRM